MQGLNYSVVNVLGNVHTNGNVLFTPDGNCLVSAIGSRIRVFDINRFVLFRYFSSF
jgi:periodic tryptophan protein 2